MKKDVKRKYSKVLRRTAAAIAVSGAATTPIAYAWPSERPIVVEAAALPELARHTGQALLLHESTDGRTLLYVEQNQGAQLAIFDVTYPEHVKSDGAVQLDAARPFDFVSPFGERAEVVRFRESNAETLLDLNKANAPVLKTAQSLTLHGTATPPVADNLSDVEKISPNTKVSQGNRLIETERVEEYSGVPVTGQIRDQVTKDDTGTTFLLTESGLYEIRRPVAERNKERREDERRMMYSGG